MHVAVAIVTMVTVNIGGETNILWCMDVGKEVNLALMGLRLMNYIELRVQLHTAGEVWYLRLPCLYSYFWVNMPLKGASIFHLACLVHVPYTGELHKSRKSRM